MTRAQALLLCMSAIAWNVQDCEAHEGEEHQAAAVASSPQSAITSSEKPRRLDNGDLYVPKSVQRLLGIRTQPYASSASSKAIKIHGEIASRPEAHTITTAPQAGVLVAPDGGWPLPGASVKAGQILAYLQPQMTLRDASRRTAQVTDFEQREAMAEINTERLRLQSAANEGQITTGNVYYEQAKAELDAAKEQRDEVIASLGDRLPLRAAASGVLIRNNLRDGEWVSTAQPVFEVSNPSQLRVTAYSFDPRLSAKVQSASLTLEGQRRVPLRLRGQEPLVGQPGWRLLFDVADADSNLSPGMPVNVELEVVADARTQQLSLACVIGHGDRVSVWLHTEPERFSPRHVSSCDASASPGANEFKPGDRLVVAGAALLAQYH